ncbi:SLBB domain-containing protein [Mucilaginibacter jinjuensis]|uniref:SLBB domain-containing protein n=1 Tax=Mucilaginibacter jinjuensis TaxID=1176721 RepID=A0ABY7T343_9SPHI|nr:SLBB domain-containing protein [Mucilaginibacter jinjuensis]WCT10615.1 SLBB domain-containing protein [Mucilaginibacter jinjuensis]
MNLKRAITALIFFLVIIVSHTAYSQSNLADVKVDELSDTQIRQIIQKAASVGYTDNNQIAQMAVAQGLSPDEAQKLTLRIDKIKKDDNNNKDNNTSSKNGNKQFQTNDYNGRSYADSTDTSKVGKRNYENDRQKQMRDAFGNLIPKIFGEDLFKNSKISFEPNLRMATPKSYVIGPDDELLIDLTGDNEANYNLKVTPDGTIRLQYVGLISVGGLTIEEATAKIKAAMSKTYTGLRTGRSSVAVNLGNIRSIKVTIIGESVKPGSYTLSSLSTVFNALYASGGPNKNGSFRKIQVIRNSKVVANIDVYDFLLKGIQKNIRLQDQDVINIPVYDTRVEMSGEVKRPALYEALKTESLQDIINFAGGFTSQAYTANIKVLQNTNRERKIVDVDADHFTTYKPVNGDKYIIEKILDRFENRVEILGAVFRPGKYELEKGMTLKQLIQKADGLKEDAFLNRGYIARLNLDNTPALLSFDVEKIINGTQADIPLQREDKVTISSIFDLRDEYRVEIKGEVRNPGIFKYGDNMNLESLIQQAGGFNEGATPKRIEISRRVKNSDAMSTSATTAQIFTVNVDQNLKLIGDPFILQPFDIVSVRGAEGYQVQKVVKIEGEVLYPGTYTIQRKDEKISDIVKRAGGLTAMAFPEGASLRRPGPEVPKEKNKDNNNDNNINGNNTNNNNNNKDRNSVDRSKEDNEKLLNLKRLQLAQGVKDSSSLQQDSLSLRSDFVGIDLVRILQKPESRYNLLMEDGDIITVPKELQTIRVSGEVLKPINIVYKSGKSMSEYINESGGFTYNASKKGAYVVYANGSIKSTKKFLFFYDYPSIKPGAEIFVPKHPPREKFGLQGIVGLSTALASLAAILVTVLR